MKYLVILASITLTACMAHNPAAQRYEATGSSSDVAYCKYEASKASVGQYATRSAMFQAIEDKMKQDEVFVACMKYKTGT